MLVGVTGSSVACVSDVLGFSSCFVSSSSVPEDVDVPSSVGLSDV